LRERVVEIAAEMTAKLLVPTPLSQAVATDPSRKR
jgi:hypothetical protein